MRKPTVLVVEDDSFVREDLCDKLRDRGLLTLEASSESEALEVVASHVAEVGVVLLDMRLPSDSMARDADSSRGRRAGLRIARFIKDNQPRIRLVGMSVGDEPEAEEWFARYGSAFLPKSWFFRGAVNDFLDVVESAARKKRTKPKPRAFIVHGRDNESLLELAHFIQTNLGWPSPKILRDLPSGGRTIIEKFEDVAECVDIVFVLLTPDDRAVTAGAADLVKRRARQNVIFELGYFYAKLQRLGGRVLLLHKGPLELPSDISGIVYIDISRGIEAAGEILRKELSPWLK